jgi:AbrB family looped-hinge helix DNA binding protein
MQTTVTERGQISIPAELRKKFKLTPGTEIVWMETTRGIYLMPVPKDPIKAFRGSGRGERVSTKLLLEERKRDRERENK